MPDNYEPKPYETSGTDILDDFVPKDLVATQAEKDAWLQKIKQAVEGDEAFKKITDPFLVLAARFLRKIPLAAAGL